MSQKPNIDLLVVSCDSFSDVWHPLFKSFYYNWKDCGLNIFLLSNEKECEELNVKTIKVGPDISWSDNLIKAIDDLKNEYVLLLLEDLFLVNKVSTNYFDEISKWINLNSPNYLRLTISHKPKVFDSLVGQIPQKTPYKTSLMPCIWKKSILKEILRSGESPWDFEIKGSLRASEYDNFYSLQKNLINYENAIVKGKWRRSVFYNNFYNLNINTISRPVMTNLDELIYYLRKKRSNLFNKLPNFLRNTLI